MIVVMSTLAATPSARAAGQPPECDIYPCAAGCPLAGTCVCDPGICDDGEACTSDNCEGPKSCSNTPIVCTPFPCFSVQCVNGACVYTYICVDGDPCTLDACDGLSCQYPPACPPLQCFDVSCDPGTGACTYTPTCTTTQPCTYAICVDGNCMILPGCNDNNPCTSDACVEGACVHTGICTEDGNLCTSDWCEVVGEGESASASCHHDPIVCTDFPCSTDYCDTGTGMCVHDSTCDEPPDACHTYTCNAQGQCEGPTPLDCDDDNNCTDDSCDPMTGCVNAWNCQPPTNLCLQRWCAPNDECAEEPLDCDDNNACTSDTCISDQGCVHTWLCDDNNPCTADYCSPTGGCGHQFECPDNNPCYTICCLNQGEYSQCAQDADPQPCSFESGRVIPVVACPGSTTPITHILCNQGECGASFSYYVTADPVVSGITISPSEGATYLGPGACTNIHIDVTVAATVMPIVTFDLNFQAESSSDGICGPVTMSTCVGSTQIVVVAPDLDVDSDNTANMPDYGPQRDSAEEMIEDNAEMPGRIVWVNNDNDDWMADEVVDFGDGYDLDGAPNADDIITSENDFVRMYLEIPAPFDLAELKIKVTYNASDPAAAAPIGMPPNINPAAGRLRIWTKNGNIARNKQSISAAPPGDYVPPGEYLPSELGITSGMRTIPLWIEGIRPSPSLAEDRVLVEIDPDGPGTLGYLCSEAARVTVCEMTILDNDNMLEDHADIGHWGEDAGAVELDGYNTDGTLKNGAGGVFIDTDRDRFSARILARHLNTDPNLQDTITLSMGTLKVDSVIDDIPSEIHLKETGNGTADFRSEPLLLMSPDLPMADNPDDAFAVYSTYPLAPVADDALHDRTHRVSIDGRIQVSYAGLGGTFLGNWAVCDRIPIDQRKTVSMRIHVLNEPFTDANGNMMYDLGEPYVEISGDGIRNTVLGSVASATAFVEAQKTRLNIKWAQACIKFEQAGGINFIEAPAVGGVNVIADGLFNWNPHVDDVAIIGAIAGAVPNVAEVVFVCPMAPVLTGYARVPSNMGAALGANAENTYVFVASNTDLRFGTLAHEFGHGLTNLPDVITPRYIYFPSRQAVPDHAVTQRRRIRNDIEAKARTCRTPGDLMGEGNRLLPGCP